MRNLFLGIGAMVGVVSMLFSQDMSVGQGWQIKGTESGFSSMEAFKKDCIEIVWGYDRKTQTWKGFSTNKKVQNIIESSPNLLKLKKINPDDGFWVKANQDCLIKKEGSSKIGTTSVIPYNFAQLWASTQPFTKKMIANKTFKTRHNEKIIFDENAFSNTSFGWYTSYGGENTEYCKVVEKNTTLDDNGNLVSSIKNKYINTETNETIYKTDSEKFRILAKDDSIGYIIISSSGDEVIPLIFDTAVENPIDMSTKLPYDVFLPWGIENRRERIYNSDGTIKDISTNDNSYNNDQNFTVEDGKIVVRWDSNYTYDGKIKNEYHDEYKFQIVFSIGDYDILKVNYSGYDKDYSVSFYDINGSWQDVDLNSSIKTWYDVFKLTNNHLYHNEYDLENGTYGNGLCKTHHFTISDDGKELTTCWTDDSQSCDKKTIENGAIVREYSGTWYGVAKMTPYIQVCNTSNSQL